jgi:sugar transferase EpsL
MDIYQFIKSIFDWITSILLIVLLAPIILLLSILIKLKLGSPIIFKQVRPGKHGKLYTMYKFRTMTNACDERGNLLPNEQRLTKFGRFLRSTSLDELPELINVLKADMALVGPRPLLPEYLALYNQQQARRHEVKPGITGWAQINGRNAISWDEKFKLDIWYVDNANFWLDMKILFLTIYKVFARQNINSAQHVTMPKFTGTKSND